MRRLMIAFVPLALTACAGAPADLPTDADVTPEENLGLTGLPVSEEIELGRNIASQQCAGCHGLDKEDAVRPDAPPLRYLLADYDDEALAEDFRDGIKVGHPDMPQFLFGPKSTDLLLSYLISIQDPAPDMEGEDEG